MAAASFDRALALVLASEGGYIDDPRDAGGATNRGITRATLARWRGRPVSKAEVRLLDRAEAVAIYRELYWNVVKGDALPRGLDLALFDYAVNSGPGRAVRTFQEVLGVTVDGAIGPRTLAAVERADPAALIRTVCRRRLSLLERVHAFAIFGRGWTARIKRVETASLDLVAAGSAA